VVLPRETQSAMFSDQCQPLQKNEPAKLKEKITKVAYRFSALEKRLANNMKRRNEMESANSEIVRKNANDAIKNLNISIERHTEVCSRPDADRDMEVRKQQENGLAQSSEAHVQELKEVKAEFERLLLVTDFVTQTHANLAVWRKWKRVTKMTNYDRSLRRSIQVVRNNIDEITQQISEFRLQGSVISRYPDNAKNEFFKLMAATKAKWQEVNHVENLKFNNLRKRESLIKEANDLDDDTSDLMIKYGVAQDR